MKHVIRHFQHWSDGSLSVPNQKLVEAHLKNCAACRKYYQEMGEFLCVLEAPNVKLLRADPFLPARVQAIVNADGSKSARPLRVLLAQWSLRGALAAFAIAIGVILGMKLSGGQTQPAGVQQSLSDSVIVNVYSSALFQRTPLDRWSKASLTENSERQ
jgi:predicted anti-sigma-YlaC factor YlaD